MSKPSCYIAAAMLCRGDIPVGVCFLKYLSKIFTLKYLRVRFFGCFLDATLLMDEVTFVFSELF